MIQVIQSPILHEKKQYQVIMIYNAEPKDNLFTSQQATNRWTLVDKKARGLQENCQVSNKHTEMEIS